MNTVHAPTVVFDTDPGADDALAILWLCALHARGRVNLAALTAVGGNVGARDTFIATGMQAYNTSIRPKLIGLVYVVPTVVIGAIIYTINSN